MGGDTPVTRPSVPRRSREQIEAIVLELLAQSNGPISAYALAGRASTTARAIAPAQIYRTLARLVDHGLVHRIETLSAFVMKTDRIDICLICQRCGTVETASEPEVVARLTTLARASGFTVSRTVIETRGCCARCQDQPREASRKVTEPTPAGSPFTMATGVP